VFPALSFSKKETNPRPSDRNSSTHRSRLFSSRKEKRPVFGALFSDLLYFQFAFDVAAGVTIAKRRAFPFAAGQFGKAPGPRDEGPNLFAVVADLDPMVVHDDGAAEDRRVSPDEFDQLADGHVIEIDVVLRHDLATGRNDVIGSVLRFGDDLAEVIDGKLVGEDILLLIRYFLVIEPFFDFAAAGAAGGIVDFYHTAEL